MGCRASRLSRETSLLAQINIGCLTFDGSHERARQGASARGEELLQADASQPKQTTSKINQVTSDLLREDVLCCLLPITTRVVLPSTDPCLTHLSRKREGRAA